MNSFARGLHPTTNQEVITMLASTPQKLSHTLSTLVVLSAALSIAAQAEANQTPSAPAATPAPATTPAAAPTPEASPAPAEAKPAPAAAPVITPAAPLSAPSTGSASSTAAQPSAAEKPMWILQMRANLGFSRNKAASTYSSDLLGAALFAGAVLEDIRIPIPVLDSNDMAVGLSYQTFTGVEKSADAAWALQAIGAQTRVLLDVGLPEGSDLSVHGGVALQRLVSQKNSSRHESVKYGAALTTGAFVRWSVMDAVMVVGGADAVIGSASWLAVSAGLETNF